MGETGKSHSGWLHVRAAPELARAVAEAADAAGVTTSEWARRAIVRALNEGEGGEGADVRAPDEAGAPVGVADLLAEIERLVREHLEPLAYSSAMDAAAGLALLERRVWASTKGDTPEERQSNWQRVRGQVMQLARDRLRRRLAGDGYSGEEMTNGDADEAT